MKGFYIEITNNLLDPKHRKAIGSALWEFMWCLDKVTSISEEGLGTVLGGRPIKLEELAKEMGGHKNTISTNLNKLAKAGYINLLRAPNGLIITVQKAKKRFSQNSESQKTVNHKILEGNHKILESNIRQDKDKAIEITPSLKGFPLFTKIEDLADVQFQEIADKYHVPISFVRSKYDDMLLWAGSRPTNGKLRGRNWKLTLMRWVKDEAVNIAMRPRKGRVIDATHL